MSSLTFTLTITTLSDWHIGSGQGRHRSVDRLVDRDHNGLPYMPAATVRGILRDSAELLARGLDEDKGSTWTDLVVQLLGSQPSQDGPGTETPPRASRLTLTGARLPAGVRQHLAHDPDRVLRQALTFVKPGVGIGRRSGRAKTDFLRFEEAVRSGAVLVADGAVDCPAEHHTVVAAFLVAAAALIERLGGKRRRGMGKCAVSISFDSLPGDAAAPADVLDRAVAPELPDAESDAGTELGAATSGSAWIRLPLRLTLLSPVIVADEVQGNVVTCQDAMPGSHLLPYVARALERAGIGDAWARIASGDVRVLPATPEIAGQRSLPVPFCWEKQKADKDYKSVRVIPLAAANDQGHADKPQYEPVRAGFVSTGEPAKLIRPIAKPLRTHNTIKDDIQRPHEDVGGVYTYEAIAARQVFRSEVWIRGAPIDAGYARAELKGEARLGRARQAGYGRVKVEVLDSTRAEELPAGSRESDGAHFRVWLTSDMVVAPGTMEGGLAVLADAIAGTVGKGGTDVFDLGASWASVRWRRIEGWQSRWGLPRPTLMALQAGSVAVLKLHPGMEVDAAALEAEGLGERRGEGFGCVSIDHGFLSVAPKLSIVSPTEVTEAEENPLPTEVDASSRAFLEGVHRRAWERCILLRAELVAGERRKAALGWEPGKPSMSQLGALRSGSSPPPTWSGRATGCAI